MAELFKTKTISDAWVTGMTHLLSVGGTESNLIIQIESNLENERVRKRFDDFLSDHELDPIDRVADTIFPDDFYRGGPGEAAREHLYKMERLSALVERRFTGDSYFDRLIDWPCYDENGEPSTWNQLEYRLGVLKTAWESGKKTLNIFELGISNGLPDDLSHLSTGDMRTQLPHVDKFIQGFPCLSHISLTLFKGRLDLTATYRNQHFINKAYGNFVGLFRLLRFLSLEIGCEMGFVICNATHGDAELGKNGAPGKKKVTALVDECRTLIKANNFSLQRK